MPTVFFIVSIVFSFKNIVLVIILLLICIAGNVFKNVLLVIFVFKNVYFERFLQCISGIKTFFHFHIVLTPVLVVNYFPIA